MGVCRFASLVVLSSLAAACTSSPLNNPDLGVADIGMSSDAAVVELPAGATTMRLVSSDYTVPAGDEFYQCQRITVTQDIYLLSITPVSPLGVHHEVLAIDPGNRPDGVSKCGPLGTNWTSLFASGVGSPSLQMPPGVALKISAGQQIVLDLHLFNATPNAVTGTAAIDVTIAPDGTGYELAGVAFVGPLNFTISEPTRQVQAQCNASRDTKYFAVFPHMHMTGQHIKVWVEGQTSDTIVWDKDYDFNDQTFGHYGNWMAPGEVDVKAGEDIHVQCTYTQGGVGKAFGDSSTEEMCFAISYFHPAISTFGSICAF